MPLLRGLALTLPRGVLKGTSATFCLAAGGALGAVEIQAEGLQRILLQSEPGSKPGRPFDAGRYEPSSTVQAGSLHSWSVRTWGSGQTLCELSLRAAEAGPTVTPDQTPGPHRSDDKRNDRKGGIFGSTQPRVPA